MRFLIGTAFVLSASLALISTCVLAEENSESSAETPKKELQDMSDPSAVYTRVGAGLTNLGVNLKVGIDYDTGKDSTTAWYFSCGRYVLKNSSSRRYFTRSLSVSKNTTCSPV
jgi:hypothetical protein